jgi:hypothetical protein
MAHRVIRLMAIVALLISSKVGAQQACSAIPLNGDTFSDMGVVLPKGAVATGGLLEVRLRDQGGDQYSPCPPPPLQCSANHGDAADAGSWAAVDIDQRNIYGHLVYNAKGALIKRFRYCVSYRMGAATTTKEDQLDPKDLADPSKPVDSNALRKAFEKRLKPAKK